MLGPSDLHLDASNTIKAETRSCFFPNSCMMEQNRIGACGKILAYLQNNLVLRRRCKVQSWFKFFVKETWTKKNNCPDLSDRIQLPKYYAQSARNYHNIWDPDLFLCFCYFSGIRLWYLCSPDLNQKTYYTCLRKQNVRSHCLLNAEHKSPIKRERTKLRNTRHKTNLWETNYTHKKSNKERL